MNAGWQHGASDDWLLALDDTFTLRLRGLALYISPADVPFTLEYECYGQWLPLELEPLGVGLLKDTWAQLDSEAGLLDTLAAGDGVQLRLGGIVWQVPPLPL